MELKPAKTLKEREIRDEKALLACFSSLNEHYRSSGKLPIDVETKLGKHLRTSELSFSKVLKQNIKQYARNIKLVVLSSKNDFSILSNLILGQQKTGFFSLIRLIRGTKIKFSFYNYGFESINKKPTEGATLNSYLWTFTFYCCSCRFMQ